MFYFIYLCNPQIRRLFLIILYCSVGEEHVHKQSNPASMIYMINVTKLFIREFKNVMTYGLNEL